MAVVLSSEEGAYFASSTLRRSHSQPKFVTKQTGFHSSASTGRISDAYHRSSSKTFADSAPSSAPSSPRAIHAETAELSWSSTPSSNLSLASDGEDDVRFAVHPDDHFVLPHYDGASYFEAVEDLEPPTSPKTGDSYSVSPADHDTSTNTSRPDTPELQEPAADDTAVRVQPSRHVDYLSHNWKEEDIWSSWKYVISRRSDYTNAARLENASWRTWMKAKNKLKTVSPETLNWFKDCDVTWLYGPLQRGNNDLHPEEAEPNSSRLSKSNSFVTKKPILKKRSMSEVMLQRSLSNSSLVKQAAAAVQAQEKQWQRRLGRPSLSRAATDYVSSPFTSRRMSRDNTQNHSVASSGLVSPTSGRKHIHFNEQVKQCIAVDVKADDEDDLDDAAYGTSDSDEDGLTMKRSTRKRKAPLKKKAKSSAPVENKTTIAMLPSTTLKSREDSDEAQETAMKHSYRSPVISPSSSQETLRPSKKSGKLFFIDDDEDEDEDDDEAQDEEEEEASEDDATASGGLQQPTITSRSAASANEQEPGLKRSSSTNSLTAEPAGMRRTPSGMFMPYEEGEPAANDGILGRVIDTVNTARDIAHVIWNVGWRK